MIVLATMDRLIDGWLIDLLVYMTLEHANNELANHRPQKGVYYIT